MIVLIYNNQDIITKIFNCSSVSDVDKISQNNSYKIFQITNAYTGLNINALTDEGKVISLSKQVELGYTVLDDNEILENEYIRKLTEMELKERNPDKENSSEKTISQIILEKEVELNTLKFDYIDAEIDNDEEVKKTLSLKIHTLRQEISFLKAELVNVE